MGKVKSIILILALGQSFNAAHAAFKIVSDPWTTFAVASNMGTQKMIEDNHNTKLDSISSKQKKLAAYSATMATIKELYKFSLQNISGFGTESQYYVDIATTTGEIITDIPIVLKYLAKNPAINTTICYKEIADIVMQTEQCAADFVDIVNNGKIQNPMKNVALSTGMFNKTENDGYNFLDRYQRLQLANKIYARIMQIKWKMEGIMIMCQYCSNMNELMKAIDIDTWAAFFTGKNMVNNIINNWNTLGV